MPLQIIDAATARAALDDTYRAPLAGGKIQIREGNTGTLIIEFDLPTPATAAAVGTDDVPGTRSITFAGVPYTGTAVASSVNDTTDLQASYVSSGGDVIHGFSLVTTTADGTGSILISGTSGHAANSKKPVIVSGNEVSMASGVISL